MPLKARVLERGLLRKGFRVVESRHRQYRYYTVNGSRTNVQTLTSHGSDRDIGDHRLGQMARQLNLTRRQFDQLIDCSLSQADFEAMMRRGGFIR